MSVDGSESRSRGAAGVMAALAALVTAIGGVLVALHGPGGSAAPPHVVIENLASPAAAPPDGSGSVSPGALRLDHADPPASASDSAARLVDDCLAGDEDSCVAILDELSDECENGDGDSCDWLYEISPVGSDYEEYGATCGARYDWEYADECGDL